MRGKESEPADCDDKRRITPAYAGKSGSWSSYCMHRWDHPRVCGEKFPVSRELVRNEGSPPRMRGKENLHGGRAALKGITPAYAGKSFSSGHEKGLVWDHPRVCGEKGQRPDSREQNQGSPPRMRGKAQRRAGSARGSGITPAYAGKRLMHANGFCWPRDHPRVCGEKTKKIPSHRPFQLHPVPVSFSFA